MTAAVLPALGDIHGRGINTNPAAVILNSSPASAWTGTTVAKPKDEKTMTTSKAKNAAFGQPIIHPHKKCHITTLIIQHSKKNVKISQKTNPRQAAEKT